MLTDLPTNFIRRFVQENPEVVKTTFGIKNGGWVAQTQCDGQIAPLRSFFGMTGSEQVHSKGGVLCYLSLQADEVASPSQIPAGC